MFYVEEGGIKVVETAGRSPEQYMPALKAGSIKVIHKCTSVRHSLKAEQIGCDAVQLVVSLNLVLKGHSLGGASGHVRTDNGGQLQ